MGSPGLNLGPGQVPGVVNVQSVATQEVDPANFGLLFNQGSQAAGWIERLAIAIWTALVKGLTFFISLLAGILDELLTVLSQFFLAAQGQQNQGFYDLTAALITDLTGLDVSGTTLFNDFQKRGRVASMQAIGGQLVDSLAGEFAGTFQAANNGVFTGSQGTGIGGLPAVQLTPEQGLNAARAFMGFVMSFAVREGNSDMFASLLPFGIGEGFKAYAEDFSKNIGLGRLGRLALKPLFQNLVAIPMTWAFNKQYTPTLLGAQEAVKAFSAGILTTDQLTEELARHGYDQTRQNALQTQHTKYPMERELFLLELSGQITTDQHTTILNKLGYNNDNAALLLKAEGLQEQRNLSLRIAAELVHPVLNGTIDAPTYSAVLDKFTLTPNEKQALNGFVNELLSHPRKRLTFAQVTTAFLDGILAVDDITSYLQQEGYNQNDISALLQIDLLKLKAAQAKAAKKTTTSTTSTPPAA